MPYVRIYDGVNQADAARTAAVHDINTVVFLIQEDKEVAADVVELHDRFLKMHGLGAETVRSITPGVFCLALKVVGEDVYFGSAGLAALLLDAGHVLLDLALQLVCNEVDGGIHVRSLLAGLQVQSLADDGHFAVIANLVHGHNDIHFQTGGLAEEAAKLFKAAACVLLEMIGSLKILKGVGNIHKRPPG